MKDPIVAEVRRHRMQHTQKFKGDMSAICADLRSIQEASGHQIVRLDHERRKTMQPSPSRPKPGR
jgi:hypothetical protein